MHADFSRTLGAIRSDRSWASPVAGIVAGVLVAAWLLWCFGAQVTVYQTSTHARVEVLPAPARLAAQVAGRVARVNLVVGAEVKANDVLIEIDATAERISLDRAVTTVSSLEAEVASVARELSSEDKASTHAATADREGVRAGLARQRAAEAELALAEGEDARMRKLFEAGAATEAEVSKAAADHREKRAIYQSLVHEGGSLDADTRQRDSARRARREQLQRQRGELEARLAVARAEVDRISHELERHVIRAPVAGTLGEVASLRPGAVVAEGAVVATVVPAGDLQVVAEYGPEAIGRLAVGQHGRLRLDGFPWMQYGTVAVEVARVASEPREGTVRVELVLREPRIAVQHGMTGTVDVEVEHTTPVALLLRTAGDRSDAARK